MHRCIKCGSLYQDEDESIIKGCPVCGSRFFLFLRNEEDERKFEKIEKELKKRKSSLEKEIKKSIKRKRKKKVKTIEFGVETLRIPKEGVYEINLKGLLEGKPLIILEKKGIYLVHLPSAFRMLEG